MKTKVLLITIIMVLLGMLYSIWNTKISWVVSDTYINDTNFVKDTYRVVIKLGDYWLHGEGCHE